MYNICFYFFMFFCYSVFGWLVECSYCSIRQRKIVHDRGFLIGPYCPIYGFGAMYMYLFLRRYYNDPVVLFVMAVVGTSMIEYLTSFVMEKMFHARWWDYSNERFHLEGRICLRNSMFFGILGLLFIYALNPLFLYITKKIPNTILIIIAVICFIIYIIDTVLSWLMMMKLRKNITYVNGDSTSSIDAQVKKLLSNYRFYFKKLFASFPKVTISIPSGNQFIETVQKSLNNIDSLRKERKKRVRDIKIKK